LKPVLSGRRGERRLGAEGSLGLPGLSDLVAQSPADIEPDLWYLRRRKDADELALIRRAIDCTAAMYAAARAEIRPGITELELFSILQAAAVNAAGEPLTHPPGNDFQCNSPGGPPRLRRAEAGELFVLDLGPAYRGYYADNCRTVCVGGNPNDAQREAWSAIVAALKHVEQTVRPGVRCQAVFHEVKSQLDAVRPGAFFHHLGHGIGLFPHEAPHLNPRWDDVFEEGDVFTAEPGLYGEDLRAGIRLEENYVVTATGVEKLTEFALEL
jgi:Xaa-Pro aminopeptidase